MLSEKSLDCVFVSFAVASFTKAVILLALATPTLLKVGCEGSIEAAW